METFGLFQFLKNILSQPDQSLEKSEMEQADTGINKTPTANAVGVDNEDEGTEHSFNAYVDFAQAHDARANRIKR